MKFVDRCYSVSLQSATLSAPIKEIIIKDTKSSDMYEAYMILEDGTEIWCNYGCIGSRCYDAKGDKEAVKAGWKKELEQFWASRNLGVLVEA